MNFSVIDVEKLCDEKTFVICAIKINLTTTKLILCCIYKAPAGNLNQFFSLLDRTMNNLYKSSVTFLICGNLNTDVLENNMDKQQLESIMETFNLTQEVNFPTRTFKNKGTLIDSLFIDHMKFKSISVHSFVNGLSDNDAQIIHLNNTETSTSKSFSKKKSRIVNDLCLAQFQSSLKEESRDTVYEANNVNCMFSNFHCTLVRI
jgi:hypothetical protein